MTTVLILVGKYGAEKVVAALTGDDGLGGLAAELFGQLQATEDRIGDRLTAIEGSLGVLLEQPYAIALGAGQRTLLDAGAVTRSERRDEELRLARRYFREASAAARTKLQLATAERYLGLCHLALGERETAALAMQNVRTAAFEHVVGLAGEASGDAGAAFEAARLCIQMIGEADALESRAAVPATHLGEPGDQQLSWWLGGGDSVRFGPLTVRWLRFEPSSTLNPYGHPLRADVAYEVRLDRPAATPLHVAVWGPVAQCLGSEAVVAAGAEHTRCYFPIETMLPDPGFNPMTGPAHLGAMFPLSTYRLVVGGVFAVPLPPDPIPLGPDGMPHGVAPLTGEEPVDAS